MKTISEDQRRSVFHGEAENARSAPLTVAEGIETCKKAGYSADSETPGKQWHTHKVLEELAAHAEIVMAVSRVGYFPLLLGQKRNRLPRPAPLPPAAS
jgi:hypothetical protein